MFSLNPVLITAQSDENTSRAMFSKVVMENSPLYFSKSPQNLKRNEKKKNYYDLKWTVKILSFSLAWIILGSGLSDIKVSYFQIVIARVMPVVVFDVQVEKEDLYTCRSW
jgi:hypothetical protein